MKDGTPFKIELDKGWMPNDIVNFSINTSRPMKVTSAPEHMYGRWYHKLLNKLTIGYRFKEVYLYELEEVKPTYDIPRCQ